MGSGIVTTHLVVWVVMTWIIVLILESVNRWVLNWSKKTAAIIYKECPVLYWWLCYISCCVFLSLGVMFCIFSAGLLYCLMSGFSEEGVVLMDWSVNFMISAVRLVSSVKLGTVVSIIFYFTLSAMVLDSYNATKDGNMLVYGLWGIWFVPMLMFCDYAVWPHLAEMMSMCLGPTLDGTPMGDALYLMNTGGSGGFPPPSGGPSEGFRPPGGDPPGHVPPHASGSEPEGGGGGGPKASSKFTFQLTDSEGKLVAAETINVPVAQPGTSGLGAAQSARVESAMEVSSPPTSPTGVSEKMEID